MSGITRKPLLVDKISLTLPSTTEVHDAIVENLYELQFNDENVERVIYGDLLKNYLYAIKLNFDSGEHCTTQYSPRRRRTNFVRIEYNPSKVEPEDIRYLYTLLQACIPDFSESLLRARITRLDLAFDLPVIEVSRILVFDTPRKLVSRTFQTNGKLNALSIGSQESDRFLLVYDKGLERAIRGERIVAQITTRFELRLKDLNGWSELQLISNPFAHYTVLEFQNAMEVSDDHIWQWFIHATNVIGAQAALSLIENKTARKRYRDLLKARQNPSWWNPDEIWAEVPQALRWSILGEAQGTAGSRQI